MVRFFGVFVLIGIISSCVPNKKLVYLQNGNELKMYEDTKVDTILRTYPIKVSEYKIQPLDILLIKYESLTSQDSVFL